MTDNNINDSLPKDHSDVERTKLALSMMNDEDIQKIFDRAFGSFQQNSLNSEDNENK